MILALLKTKLGQYLIVGLVTAATLGAVTYYIYHKGYVLGVTTTEVKYKKIYDDELNRQLEVQDKIINTQKQIITELQKSEDDLNKKLKENEDEAAKDSDYNKPAISSSAVMRLNRIR
jgi:hypothetical protein